MPLRIPWTGPVLLLITFAVLGAAVHLFRTPLAARTDYFNGAPDWISGTVVLTGGERLAFGTGEWSGNTDGAQPGALRIWHDSLDLSSYDFSFRGQVDLGALGFAFRATDSLTFYGAKVILPESGNGYFEHFVRIGGRNTDVVRIPLPSRLWPRQEFTVECSVRGNQFSAAVNGERIDTWNDSRLKTGGVGFYTESGEGGTVRWIRLRERDSMLGRALGIFTGA